MFQPVRVPFADLKSQYLSIKEEITEAIQSVLQNSTFIGHQPVSCFEKAFARYQQAAFAVGCANGSDAIEVTLQALGINIGDEVIVPALTWISTASAVSNVGAKAVFADIHTDYTLSVAHVESLINLKTKAIIAVHLYGQPARMEALKALAKKHNLFLIEDAAQAHGAEINGTRVGNFGDAATFSFYPGKNLGAYGDAGAIVSTAVWLEEPLRRLVNQGQLKRHEHLILGRTSRLDTLQAAILQVKLKYIEQWTETRRSLARQYQQELVGIEGLQLPEERPNLRHVYHLFVVRANERQKLQAFLKAKHIDTAVHYPEILPLLACYAHLQHRLEDFPVAAQSRGRLLSLPLYPEMTRKQVSYVCENIRKFYAFR